MKENKYYQHARSFVHVIRKYPNLKTVYYTLRYFFAWFKYMQKPHSPIHDQKPWIGFAPFDFLTKIIHKDMVVYEWGSGGSTLFWANRVKQVISIEHERAWFNRVKQIIGDQQRTNIVYKLILPEPDNQYTKVEVPNPLYYFSDDYPGMNFSNYVRDIEQYPDESFDIVFVDGRCRPSCVWNGMKKVKKGGYLILDNSERENYQRVKQFMNGWNRRDFLGPVLFTSMFSCTSFYKKCED